MTDETRPAASLGDMPFEMLHGIGSFLSRGDRMRLSETGLDTNATFALEDHSVRVRSAQAEIQKLYRRITRLEEEYKAHVEDLKRGLAASKAAILARVGELNKQVRTIQKEARLMSGGGDRYAKPSMRVIKESMLAAVEFPRGLVQLSGPENAVPPGMFRFGRDAPESVFPGATTGHGFRGDIVTAWMPDVLPQTTLQDLRKPPVLREMRARVAHNLGRIQPLIDETARVLATGPPAFMDYPNAYPSVPHYAAVVMFVMIVLPYMHLSAEEIIPALVHLSPPRDDKWSATKPEHLSALVARMVPDLVRYAREMDARTAWVTAATVPLRRGGSWGAGAGAGVSTDSYGDFVTDD